MASQGSTLHMGGLHARRCFITCSHAMGTSISACYLVLHPRWPHGLLCPQMPAAATTTIGEKDVANSLCRAGQHTAEDWHSHTHQVLSCSSACLCGCPYFVEEDSLHQGYFLHLIGVPGSGQDVGEQDDLLVRQTAGDLQQVCISYRPHSSVLYAQISQ